MLKHRVERWAELTWDEIPVQLALTDEDSFEPDYVSIEADNGIVYYFIISELDVLDKAKDSKLFK